MSSFSDQFSAGMEYLATASGEPVVYKDPCNEERPATAIVGNATVIRKQSGTELQQVRSREFTFTKSETLPVIFGVVAYSGEKWTITEIVKDSATHRRVRCEFGAGQQKRAEGTRERA